MTKRSRLYFNCLKNIEIFWFFERIWTLTIFTYSSKILYEQKKILNISFNEKRFTISEKYSTHLASKNVNSENFSWKIFFKIVSKQQKNAIVQFVSSVFSAAFVIISISIEKMLWHVTKKNSEFSFSASSLSFQKTAEVSFRFINNFQQYIKKKNSSEIFHLSTFFAKSEFFVISKIKTTSEFDYFSHRSLLKIFKITKKFSLFIFSIKIKLSESKKTKVISAKQFIVYSKFSNSEKSSIQILSKKNSRLIVKKFSSASLTSQKFVWFFRIFFIREKTKNFLMQFFFFANFFEFRNLDFFSVSVFFSSIQFIFSSKFFLFCIFLTIRFCFHYFLSIRANNSEIQTDFFVVNDFLFSNSSKIVKFIEQNLLSQRQHQKKVSNWKSKKFLKLFKFRDTSQQNSIFSYISDFRVQKLKNFQNSTLLILFFDFFQSFRSS